MLAQLERAAPLPAGEQPRRVRFRDLPWMVVCCTRRSERVIAPPVQVAPPQSAPPEAARSPPRSRCNTAARTMARQRARSPRRPARTRRGRPERPSCVEGRLLLSVEQLDRRQSTSARTTSSTQRVTCGRTEARLSSAERHDRPSKKADLRRPRRPRRQQPGHPSNSADGAQLRTRSSKAWKPRCPPRSPRARRARTSHENHKSSSTTTRPRKTVPD